MSSDSSVAIRVEGVSKSFRTLRRPLERLVHLLNPRESAVASADEFRALDNVSFEVERGKAFGIMGQNGSGKSTLLQIISGIMTPTAGKVSVEGKVAALLELGSGFNPEFTGLENVYLNASVLGLSKAEIDDKLEAIIAFADIGVHIDLPVKTYSSGMMLRLAFAVQVSIEPEILIIDEALAVGDAKFQLKCFRRLEQLKANGTTILFVSHAVDTVKSFCDSALVLHKSRPIFLGDAKVATIKYLETLFPDQQGMAAAISDSQGRSTAPSLARIEASGTAITINGANFETSTFGVGGASLQALRIEGIESPNTLVGGEPITFLADFSWDKQTILGLIKDEGYAANITLGISIANRKGEYIFGCNGFDAGLGIDCVASDSARLRFSFAMPYLVNGDYFVSVAIALGDTNRHIQLKWYDCFVAVQCATRGKNVYGLLGIDYSLDRIEGNVA